MKPLLPGILIVLLTVASLYGQETDYQRYDIVRKQSEIVLEGSVKTWAETANEYSLYTTNIGFQGEYTFLTRHTVTVNLPYTFARYNNPESRMPWLYSFGNMGFSYNYLKQFGHINLFAGPRLSVPLAEASEYAAREGVYSASSGRYSLGAEISITGVRDPVVWNAGLAYDLGLPKEERFYTTLEPGNIQITAGFSDLFNERFGFTVGITQYIKLPVLYNGKGKPEDLRFTTAGKGEFLVLFEKDYMKFTLETTLFPLNSPFVLGFTYGRQFDLNKKP
ncbi:MAG: hypothetical protein LBL31_03365 [Spirochaetaceae bacterium]|jgi:hypothetical protein|nr:hypothetical protein [Spirochaetaceae bacterium]